MTLSTTKLAGSQYLVEGTDCRGNSGSAVLDGSEWDRMVQAEQVGKAHEEFDAKVEEFFKPLTDAADALVDAHVVKYDPLLYVVEQTAVEGTPGREQVLRELAADTVVLRAINTGHADRLIWVKDQLVVIAATPQQEATIGAEPSDDPAPAPRPRRRRRASGDTES